MSAEPAYPPAYSDGWYNRIPVELKSRDQWVVWRLEVRDKAGGDDGKPTKVPYVANDSSKGRANKATWAASSTDPNTWRKFNHAGNVLHSRRYTHVDGVGFVFSIDDPFCGVDLDNCLDPDGQILPWARPYFDQLMPTYAEVSPSGRGIKLFVRGMLPSRGMRQSGLGEDGQSAIELYDCRRFFTTTGSIFDPACTTIEDRSEVVAEIYETFRPAAQRREEKAARARQQAASRPATAATLTLSEEQIIKKAREAKNAAKFCPLFDGDKSKHGNDWSRADLALVNHLVFWTGGDVPAIDRIFRQSKLYRPKWDEYRGDDTYGEITIDYALSDWNGTHFKPRRKVRFNGREKGGAADNNGYHDAKRNGTPEGTDKADWEAIGQAEADERAKAQAEAVLDLSNFDEVEVEDDEGNTKTFKEPLRAEKITELLSLIVGEWPRRADETLFWEGPNHEPVYLDSSTRLFAWADRMTQVDWTKGARFVTQERFYEHLRMTARRYDAIEVIPHTPRLPDIYYMHQPLPAPGDALETFLDFFTPDSDLDKELIRALLLTALWGGTPGRRPAFMITGPDQDPEQGRGLGKTTLVDIIADELMGGSIDVSPTDAIADVKTRLLSEAARQTRIARLDNVKTLRFSWADLEGLITASEISGHALYIGEGRRPNTLLWLITLNGASLSKDMAQRVIPIKLKRPVFKPKWEEDVRTFAAEHRWEILAGIIGALEAKPGDITPKTRWAAWEQEVLSKVNLPMACQALVIDRQGAVDDDNEERGIVADFFRSELKHRNYEPDFACLFFRSATAARWLHKATRNNLPTNRASSYLAGLGISELRKSKREGVPGWVWRGQKVVAGTTAETMAPHIEAAAGDADYYLKDRP